MSNPLFNLLGNAMPNNPMMARIQQFNQFRQQFRGNPEDVVKNMLNTGRITQEQYNNAVQQANSIRNMFGI